MKKELRKLKNIKKNKWNNKKKNKNKKQINYNK